VQIKLHGGACCGIKHIHGMGEHPKGCGQSDTCCMLAARSKLTGEQTSFGRSSSSGVNDAHADEYPEDFFCDEAPQELPIDRLDRMLAFLKKHRKHGIVEIVLILGQKRWFPVLEERGFTKVTEAKNSNTHNTLFVFHLAY
jgi:hypothetical protein